ncbi:MmgE/PrpD family protein [Subtercola endophyticus]|uniref:MmgE/PrpD family protein n=1 Tax=Subtercola endophyticus TaxID=2895559 RepID=UPI001E55D5B1|nr:MmgE/PrpD family protein [Subtercola endophyticus]UFS58101.1 MmgE/PrpD family protein [Subtercola endophyticus]
MTIPAGVSPATSSVASGAGGMARALAEKISELVDAPLTSSAVTAVSNRLTHSLGVSLASTALQPFTTALDALTAEPGEAVVVGSSTRLAPGAAAFVNAVTAHSSLQEDCGPGGFREGSHPGTYVIPAALAAADLSGCSGDRLQRAIIAGYEAVHRLGLAVPPALSARRFRPVGVMGPFGAAVAAAYALGGDAEAVGRAIGIAANTSAGTSQGFVSGSMEPYFHAGFAARNGLLAASLAVAGAPSAELALEGEHGFFAVYAGQAALTDPLFADDERLAIEGLGSKKYAVCLQNQESIELADEVRELIGGREIDAVVLRRPNTPENGTASPGVGADGPYETRLQRQMSARFTAAAALLGRPVNRPFYFESAGSDAATHDLAERVHLQTSTSGDVEYVAHLSNGETVALAGRRPGILFPDDESFARLFLVRATPVLGEARASAALGQISLLGSAADARSLTKSFAL